MNNKDNTPRQSYLQFHVPSDMRSLWYQDLMAVLDSIAGVKIQNGFFHVTAAFINDKIGIDEATIVGDVIAKELAGVIAPELVFDTLDAFTTQGGGMHVVYLTASREPGEFAGLIARLRSTISSLGYDLGPFRLHVTLARVPAKSIALGTLRDRIGKIGIPKISLTLTTADYRYFREFRRAIREWKLPVG